MLDDTNFQLLADLTHSAVREWNIPTNRVRWSPTVTLLFGFKDTGIGLDAAWWYDQIHPDDRDAVSQGIRDAIDQGHERWEAAYRFRNATGAYLYIEDKGRFLKDANGKSTHLIAAMTDMTHQRELEQAVQDATDKSRVILESITDTFFAIDREWRFTYVNKQCEHYFGKPRSELLGRTYWEILGIARASEFDRHYQKAMDEQKAVHFEAFSPYSRRWLEVHAFPSLEGLSVYFRDISGRKQTEAHRQFLMDINDAIRFTRSPVEVLESVSELTGHHFKVSRCAYGDVDQTQQNITISNDYTDGVETVSGTYRLDDFGPDIIRELKTGKTVVLDDVRDDPRTADKLVGEAYASIQVRAAICVPLVKDSTLVAVFSVHDQTPRIWTAEEIELLEQIGERTWFALEQVEAEQRLKRSEEEFRQLADLMPQMVWVTRPNGVHEYYNQRWYEYTGFKKKNSMPWHTLVHTEDRDEVLNRWQYSLKTGSVYEAEYRLQNRLGEYRWVLARAYPIRDDSGAIIYWFGTSTDIHDRILLEQELRLAKEKAESANLAKSEFLANISHELRTPMNAVVGLANILKRKQLTPEQQREFIDTMQMSAQQLMELINDLLDVVKLETRNVELESLPFTLHEVITEIISINAVKAKEKGIELHVNEPPETVTTQLQGDPLRVRQILMNLVGNAVKFTEQGQVILDIEFTPLHAEGQMALHISVTDTGIGIPEHKLDTIFSKFSQADTSVTRKYGGTGLGLSITKTLVELMNGSITVESKPGKGSTFRVTLPFQTSEMTSENTTHTDVQNTDEQWSDNHDFRVLLVEDYKANVMVATSLLEAFGYSYGHAQTGREALDKLEQEHYDLVLMDIQMPEMDGFKATRLIREKELQSGTPRLPIIGITAHALKGDREKCLAAGMDEYISKPFQAEELKHIIQRFQCLKLGNGITMPAHSHARHA